MKKLFLLALLIPAFLVSCSDNDPVNGPEEGKGSIRLNAEIKMAAQTRAYETPAFADLSVELTGPDGTQTMGWPTGGLIEGLDAGSYTVKVTTHLDGMPTAPGFDSAYWLGEATAAVIEGGTTTVPVEVSLQNGGVFFNYAADLAGVNVVPTVKDANNVSIAYPDRTEDVAYFAPGADVTVTATIDGNPAKVNGHDSRTLPIQANHVWKVTLQKTIVEGGDITINVTFEDVDIEDVSYGISPGDGPGPGERQMLFMLDIEGQSDREVIDEALALCTLIDKDGDGYQWMAVSFIDDAGQPTGEHAVISHSWIGGTPLTPENYLILPGQALGTAGKINLAVIGQDPNWYDEKFKVIISDSPITSANCRDAEVLFTHTLTSEARYATEIDIPASYNGKTVYVGICHFDVTDFFALKLYELGVSHMPTTRSNAQTIPAVRHNHVQPFYTCPAYRW